MKRLGYRKSRNGCLRCKERRVKSDPFPYFSRFLTDLNKSETASGWISDLELMHHYTSVSYSSFSSSTAAQKALQYDVPREALSHPFLLHQLLAFSAYHLAYLQPDCRHAYLMQAAQHQNDAINGMRAALLGTISSINCHALFASSIFLTLSAFATYPSYEQYNPAFSPIDSILDIFTLSDGMSVILRASDDDLRKGPLRGIINRNVGDGTPSVPLQPLFERLPRLSSRLAELGPMENEVKYTINNAVIALSESISKVASFNGMSSPLELRCVFVWPILMSSDYLETLRQRHPAALAVLAHYCIVINTAETFCWFLKGWARALMNAVSDQLAGTPWAELIVWPMEEIVGGGYGVNLDHMPHAMPIAL
ncbi:Sterol uptake control protein 2-like protein 8 [Colletotrichum chlorophyti]|uniref:Sterol uptake control protein 2-like protein 8 n=1 Tax=Colletotrichum chlorophyti TaxID=708187 RepID=A0A1Q8RRU0_9PEZI|nr:Sterol uptake control protein 2-like protein 8 [Colletotrichum chlorophyti]